MIDDDDALLSPITGCHTTVYEDGSGVTYCGTVRVHTYPDGTLPWHQ